MKCHEFKSKMDELFKCSPMELPEAMQKHIESCDECMTYCKELSQMSEMLTPLTNLELAKDEAARLEKDLREKMIDEPAPIPVQPRERKMISWIRTVTAVALVTLIVLFVYSPEEPNQITTALDWTEIDPGNIDSDVLAEMIFESDEYILNEFIDESTAEYITSQIQLDQAYDLLESLTEEELAWLSENFTMEI
ncbi:MAG: hypothetical protein V3V99_12145 [candidate division Zixibacteria bacterium]